MEVIRRNTDYALRAMVVLAGSWQGEPVSAREIAETQDVSYQLVCKLLQTLHREGLVKSAMGVRGGYTLGRPPEEISLIDVVNAIQGPIKLNKCLLGTDGCCKQKDCPIRSKLAGLQGQLDSYLGGTMLAEIVATMNKAEEEREGDA